MFRYHYRHHHHVSLMHALPAPALFYRVRIPDSITPIHNVLVTPLVLRVSMASGNRLPTVRLLVCPLFHKKTLLLAQLSKNIYKIGCETTKMDFAAYWVNKLCSITQIQKTWRQKQVNKYINQAKILRCEERNVCQIKCHIHFRNLIYFSWL